MTAVQRGPAALVFDGEAGIGKTTAWLAAITAVRQSGFRVLTARVGQAESVLAYAASFTVYQTGVLFGWGVS